METLTQFRERTWFVHQPWEGGLQTSAGLAKKVGPDGEMRTYLGDTVIFDLDGGYLRVA